MQLYSTFVLVAGLALAFASPVNKIGNHEDTDVVIVPLESQLYLEDGDVGFPGGFFSFNPFGNPFSGFIQGMDDMLKNLRDQMSQVMHRYPSDNTEWTELGDGKGNTTSTTKVINGHKVTINETTYSNGDENSGSLFKIRIVDVHPASEESESDNKESEEEKTAETPKVKEVEEVTSRDVEKVDTGSSEIEESANEIPQRQTEINNSFEDDIETANNEPSVAIQSNAIYSPEMMNSNEIDFVPHLPDIETNEVNSYPNDLSSDIYINNIMADSGAPHDPDSEIIEPYISSGSYSRDTLVAEDSPMEPNAEVLHEEEENKKMIEYMQSMPQAEIITVD